MKIVIQCSEDEHVEAQEVEGWIRDGEFESDINIDIKLT